jgi:hypothetical protein
MKCLAASVALAACFASPPAAQTWGEWELVLTFFAIGQEPAHRLYGIMVSQEACQMAGEALADRLMAAESTVSVGVTCRLRVSA